MRKLYILMLLLLTSCSYSIKPYTCYFVRQNNSEASKALNANYLCITNDDKEYLQDTDITLKDSFIFFILDEKQKSECSFEEYDRDSNEYFVYKDKKIDLKHEKVYSCQSGTVQPYVKQQQKEAKEAEKKKKQEEKKKQAEEAKRIKEWEKYTGCNYKKSIYLPGEAYTTFQQQTEGLTIMFNRSYHSYIEDNNLPYSFFVIQNKIDKHFVDNEAWIGGWFEDTGVDRKYINGLGHMSRIRKYKRCIDGEVLEKFKKMGIQ